MKYGTITGVDPGANGAIVTLRRNLVSNLYSVERVFRLSRGEDSIVDFFSKDLLRFPGPHIVYLEKVHGWGRDGSGGAFKFGANYGLLRGCIKTNEIRLVDVTPQLWMKTMGLPPMQGQKAAHREAMREMAALTQDEVETTNWNSAAILISFYGLTIEENIYAKNKN